MLEIFFQDQGPQNHLVVPSQASVNLKRTLLSVSMLLTKKDLAHDELKRALSYFLSRKTTQKLVWNFMSEIQRDFFIKSVI